MGFPRASDTLADSELGSADGRVRSASVRGESHRLESIMNSSILLMISPQSSGSGLAEERLWWIGEGLQAPLWFLPLCVILWLIGHTTEKHTVGAELARLRKGRVFPVLLGIWIASACAWVVMLAVR